MKNSHLKPIQTLLTLGSILLMSTSSAFANSDLALEKEQVSSMQSYIIRQLMSPVAEANIKGVYLPLAERARDVSGDTHLSVVEKQRALLAIVKQVHVSMAHQKNETGYSVISLWFGSILGDFKEAVLAKDFNKTEALSQKAAGFLTSLVE